MASPSNASDASSASPPAATSSAPPPSSRDSSLLPCAGVPLPDNHDSLPVLTRAQIASRIARGDLLVLHPPLVYRIPHAWLRLHPGGDLALLHYVGRDASCEIEAYHTGNTVKERMGRWVVGRVEVDEEDGGEGWRDMVPPIQMGKWPIPVPDIKIFSPPASPTKSRRPSLAAAVLETDEKTPKEALDSPKEEEKKVVVASSRILTPEMVDPPLSPSSYSSLPLTPAYQAHLRRSHRALMHKIHLLGLDTPPPFLCGYGPSLLIYASLFSLAVWTYSRAVSMLDYTLAGFALGLFWHQVTFVAHDAGHTGLTGDWWTDRLWGVWIANFGGGLSIGWWADNHNVHHLVTNAPEHDPDIQHLPFFAITTKFFNSLYSTYHSRVLKFDAFARRFLPHQHKLYYLIMCFARFNLGVQSYLFLSKKWPGRRSPLFTLRQLEIVGIAVFYAWFVYGIVGSIPSKGMRWVYVLVSFAVTSPLHVQIVLSHFSQPVSILPPAAH
ncbi:hypothetical protein JCM8547_000251 [Rhodosporidiobolus lusitaniae]